MDTVSRAALLVVVAALVGGAIFLLAPDKVNNDNEAMNTNMVPIVLESSAFPGGGVIPARYTCDADNVNPPLEIRDIPEDAVSLVLLMDDPDIPQAVKDARGIDTFDHWTVFNISPHTTEVREGVEPDGTAGANSAGNTGYTGPCPPTQYQPTEHRYFFKLYALDTTLDLPEGATRAQVLEAMGGHIIGEATLMGRYDRAAKTEDVS